VIDFTFVMMMTALHYAFNRITIDIQPVMVIHMLGMYHLCGIFTGFTISFQMVENTAEIYQFFVFGRYPAVLWNSIKSILIRYISGMQEADIGGSVEGNRLYIRHGCRQFLFTSLEEVISDLAP